jgi:acetyl-CoA decarbonylase/synthase complex subunit gamma
MTSDPMKEAVIAGVFIAKYGGIVVLSDIQGHSLFPLLVERLNIFTDPQRPLATAEGIYEIGKPDKAGLFNTPRRSGTTRSTGTA